nr:ATP-dependent DNA helicase RRM3-like [Tanacetum cinerariifolium]
MPPPAQYLVHQSLAVSRGHVAASYWRAASDVAATSSPATAGQRRSTPPAIGQRRRVTVVIGGQRWRSTPSTTGQRWRSTMVAGGEPPLTAAGPPLTPTGPPPPPAQYLVHQSLAASRRHVAASYWTAASDLAATSSPATVGQRRLTPPANGGQRRLVTVVIGGQRWWSTTVNATDHRSTVAVNDGRRWRTTVDCRWTTVDHRSTVTTSAACRSKRGIVLNFALSGIATLHLEAGRIAYSRFAIPINVVEDSLCNIFADSELDELLRMTKLVIWDEVPMVN